MNKLICIQLKVPKKRDYKYAFLKIKKMLKPSPEIIWNQLVLFLFFGEFLVFSLFLSKFQMESP